MLNSSGDGKNWVKVNGNSVEIGTNGSAKVTVDSGGQVTLTGDLNAAGGQVSNFTFYRNHVVQNSTPHMTASIVSGTNLPGFTHLRQPLYKAGSILGIAIYTGNATVKSGSLSASVTIDGASVAGATCAIHTGTTAASAFSKDTYTFNASSVLGVQLTGSSTYFTDTETLSGSWIAVVTVEM